MNATVKKILVNPYTISLLAMILIVIALYAGVFTWLDSYTKHGEEVILPDLSDLSVAEAEEITKDKNIKCAVIDSVFMKGRKLGVVVEQIPPAGSAVKEGRTIYLITNSNTIRKVALPDVRELSLRQAEAVINSVGLKVDSIQYIPSDFKDLVKDVRLKDGYKEVAVGTRIPEGSAVILLVGRGETNEVTSVPSFRTLNADQSVSRAHSSYLNIGEIYYDVEPKDEKDKESYFVYKQVPLTGTTTKLGATISIYLTKDPTKLEVPEEKYVPENGEEGAEEDKDELFQ